MGEDVAEGSIGEPLPPMAKLTGCSTCELYLYFEVALVTGLDGRPFPGQPLPLLLLTLVTLLRDGRLL